MSILDSIKGERKLTFRHWRYRILHWAFSVKDPKKPADTGLPQFLYSHYCPLFHLTNIIVLLSPFILLFKTAGMLGRGFVAVVGWAFDLIPVDKIAAFFRRIMPEPAEEKVAWVPPPTRLQDRRKFLNCISDFHGDFEQFWNAYSNRFQVMERDEVAALFASEMLKIESRRERLRNRREKWRKRIIFLTNFSRVFIKGLMNAAYLGVGGLIAYSGYEYSDDIGEFFVNLWEFIGRIGGKIGTFFTWLFTESISLEALKCVGVFVGGGAIMLVIIGLLVRTGIVQRSASVVFNGLLYISPVVTTPAGWIKSGVEGVCEFVSMFYEENCPPITIVREEEV